MGIILTSGDLFKAALRKCGGVIAEGETPSQELMEDTRQAFNLMLDAWSAESLSVFSTQDQQFTWPAGVVSRTLGPSGDFLGLRPVRLLDSSFFKIGDLSYPLSWISKADYNTIMLKSSTSSIPYYAHAGDEVPNIIIYLYPVPTQALECHFISPKELTQVNDLFTNIICPPGYQQAFIFNLAALMCVELGLEPPSTVKKIATSSKRVLRANNAGDDYLKMPAGLASPRRFDINTGE